MTKRSSNVLLGVFLIVFGIFIAYSASLAKGNKMGTIGPSFFPMLAAILLSVLGAYTVIYEFLKGEKTEIRFISRKFLITIVSLGIYTILLRFLGYVISGMLIMVAIMALMRTEPLKKTWMPMLLVLVLAPIIIYVIFAKFLLVPLPAFSLW